MNRYQATFSALKQKKQAAFIPFAVAGDTNSATSEAIFKTYIDNGADILEIGFPFSDPVADGPVNQRAGQRAIDSGFTHATFFSLIAKIRSYTDCPIGILLYANSIHYIGYNEFCKKAADSGIDSLLVADMPPEEFDTLGQAMDKYNIAPVFIVSELTPPDRMTYICDHVKGFVYVVSRLGTTGVNTTLGVSVQKTLAKLKKATDKPLCVGFGISTPQHVTAVKAAGAHGIIVGSALVKIIEDNQKGKARMLQLLAKSVADYKKATC